jgi:DHA2 family multidrug resistance protein
VMGIGLYAMAFTLPVFLQTNLRMTAEQTGIVLLPGAIATAVSMAIVGRLTNRIDPRLLITAGALIFALAAWKLSLITGESGTHDFFWPLILRGLGLGLMFVPLTTITLAELSTTELAQGTGLYNFFRQLGGSFGIAGISTLVTRYTAQTRAMLVEHVSNYGASTVTRVEMLTRGMMAQGADFLTARRRALALLDHQLMGQASVIAYGKIYVLAALIILLLIPLLLLVRQTKGAGGADAPLSPRVRSASGGAMPSRICMLNATRWASIFMCDAAGPAACASTVASIVASQRAKCAAVRPGMARCGRKALPL